MTSLGLFPELLKQGAETQGCLRLCPVPPTDFQPCSRTKRRRLLLTGEEKLEGGGGSRHWGRGTPRSMLDLGLSGRIATGRGEQAYILIQALLKLAFGVVGEGNIISVHLTLTFHGS